jgi:maleate isomerase
MQLKQVTIKGLEAMEKDVVTAAKLLGDADVDLVAFGCTSGSLFKGLVYDESISKLISKAADCTAITTAGAVVQALKSLKVKKISLATPYIQEINQAEIDFLSKIEFEIAKTQTLNLSDNLQIGRLSIDETVDLAKRAYCPLSDGTFISCTNLKTFEAIPLLEQKFSKPVVSSNSATLWAALSTLEVRLEGNLGRLFESLVR